MGHTVYPMRCVVYDKLRQMKKLCKGLREPERSIAEGLLYHVYQYISAVSYANPFPDDIENNMLFCMLIEESKDSDISELTMLIFSLIVTYKLNKLKNPDESNIYRLLQKPG